MGENLNIFELLIYAIITIIIFFLIMVLFTQDPNQELIIKLKENLKIAQTESFLGKTITIENQTIPKEFYLHKSILEEPLFSVAIECNNPKVCCIRNEEKKEEDETCNKPLNWDYTHVQAKAQTVTKISVRCIQEESFPLCRVFFGYYPPQAEIIDINNTVNESSNTIFSNIKVKNSGETQLSTGKLELILQKKLEYEWEDTETTFQPQEVKFLLPKQEHTFIWAIQTLTAGKYRLIYKFSGDNAGHNTKIIDYNIGKNSACSIIEETSYETKTIEERTKYKEIKYCKNCNYAFECAAAWQEKYPQVNYEVLTKEKTSCEKNNEFITCESTIAN